MKNECEHRREQKSKKKKIKCVEFQQNFNYWVKNVRGL